MFLVKFGVLKAVLMKILFFWDATPCQLVILALWELAASTLGSLHSKKTHLSNSNYLPIDMASYPRRMEIMQTASCW
jgi:hypothetical protein